MTKYMYLPDKNGHISRCGAQDHNNCPYHLGPDGKPLKHYATPEEARKAYEDAQAKNHNTKKLSKKTSISHTKYTPGPNGLDERFVPSQYWGLSMDELESKLDKNLKADRERLKNFSSYEKKLAKQLKDESIRLDLDEGDPIDHSGRKPPDTIANVNKGILDYKHRVRKLYDNLKQEADECNGNAMHSRYVLRMLEKAHPGADYGSYEKDDDTVCDNAKAYIEGNMEKLSDICADIGPTSTKTYEADRRDLLHHENEVYDVVHNMRGLTGGLDEKPLQIDTIRTKDDDPGGDYGHHDYLDNVVKKHHPYYGTLSNQLDGAKARVLMETKKEEQDAQFRTNLKHLKTMKPISGPEAQKALRTAVTHSFSDYGAILKKKGRAIAESDNGEILIEVSHDDGGKEYEIRDRHGRPTDAYAIRDYDKEDPIVTASFTKL